jgi:cardiolipin synthase
LAAHAPVHALFDHDDVISDGASHRSLFQDVLRRARERVLIHSTFVSPGGWNAALLPMLEAAANGAKVHVFWGQADDARGNSSSRDACDALRAAIANAGRQDDIIVHPFTTGSHAKLIVADDGNGRWAAIVGSCNWLSVDFESFDASVRMRDPEIVGQILSHMARLAVGSDGIWNKMAGDLAVLGRRIAANPRGNGRTAPVRVLLAPDHADLVLDARDSYGRRHKLRCCI